MRILRHTAFIMFKFCLCFWLVLLWPAPGRADFASAVAYYDQSKFGPARDAFNGLALRGHAGAEFMLGAMYFYGKGVGRDDAIAAIWFHKSAIKGNAFGQLAFGSLHIRGLGLRQDLVKAYGWLTVAANHAIPSLQQQAITLRDEAVHLMRPDEIAIALRWASGFKATAAGLTLD
jgi:hypothetical protein